MEYVLPTPERVDQYVHSVCMALTKKQGADYCDIGFVHGLTNFVQVVMNIQVKHLNEGVKNAG